MLEINVNNKTDLPSVTWKGEPLQGVRKVTLELAPGKLPTCTLQFTMFKTGIDSECEFRTHVGEAEKPVAIIQCKT